MQKSIIMIGIIICAVGALLGIIGTFLYPDIMILYLNSDLVDVLRLLSVFGFISFIIGFLISVIGALSKRKIFKKTKLISFNRYYDP